MKTELIRTLTTDFEAAAQRNENVEYWEARTLQDLLGYSEWRNFLSVIEKAKMYAGMQARALPTILLTSTKWSTRLGHPA